MGPALTCAAFLGMSMDGFIAGPNGELEWLDSVPNPTESDLGYFSFIGSVDAIIMGRRTFETVLGFDGEWPYDKPIIVMSKSMTELPDKAVNSELSALTPPDLVAALAARGMSKIYVDGGAVVTSFLEAGLLDEITTTTIPIVLGGGIPLFGVLSDPVAFDLVSSEVLIDALVQTTYRRRAESV